MGQTRTENTLPAHASVVVIGGGVMGCSTLYHLARAGVRDALLLERHQLTSGTTWHSAAQVRALRGSRNLTELIRYSISLYGTLERDTGQSVGWINEGSLSIACNPDRLMHIRRQAALAGLFGVRADTVSVGEAKERFPLMNTEDVLGAVWSPDDGRVSPSDLCAALVKGARAAGATIMENTAVTGIRTKGGRICGVETNAGAVRCDAVALCAGLWSREVGALAGAEVPLYPCEHFYLLTKPFEGISGNLPTLSDHDSHLYFRDDSGGLLAGCFEPMGKAVSPQTLGDNFAFQLLAEDWEHFNPMIENAMRRIPALQQAEVKMLLNGPESFTPDSMFMLGEAAETRGLFLGCGMNSVGVATGGGAGHALAHCIVTGRLPAALPEADPKRFPACFNSAQALSARVPEVLGKHYEIDYPGRQYLSARDLRLPPATALWREHRAHFGQYYGWERPLYFNKTAEPVLTFSRPDWFAQVGKEVEQAHRHTAIFDLSTLGKIRVSGEGGAAETFLNRICAGDMTRKPGSVIYTAMLNDKGGMESDLTAQRLDEHEYMLYTGSGAIKRDMAWLQHLQEGETIRISDETGQWAVFSLVGGGAAAFAEALGRKEWNAIPPFRHRESVFKDKLVRVARLSYVGEYGWEITCRAEDALTIATALTEAGAAPAGLYAQTAMRIEKRFVSYGHDVDAGNTPLAAGLPVHWDHAFIGREALLRERDEPDPAAEVARLVSLVAEADADLPVMLGHEPVLLNDAPIGQVMSAAYGYRVGKQVGLAWIRGAVAAQEREAEVSIDVGGVLLAAKIVYGAVFDPAGQRMRGTRS